MQSTGTTEAASVFITKFGVGAALAKAFNDAKQDQSEKKVDSNEPVQSKL